MAITAAEQTFFNNAINTVFRDDKDDLTYARKLLNQNSDNIPALLTALNKLCGCSFSDKAGLQNSPPPQAVADSISTAVTAAGGTPSDAVALKRKVGSAELTTTAKDLSGAVNELDGEVGSATLTTSAQTIKAAINEHDTEIGSATLKTGSSTIKGSINELVDYVNTIAGTDTTLPAAVNALTAKVDGVSTASDSVAGIIGDVPLTTTAQTLSGGITELDGEIGGATLTTDATTVKAAINEVDANADTAQAAVDAVEVILGSSSMASVSSASNTATGIIGNNALPAMGVTGSTTTPTTLSGAVGSLNTAVGTSSVAGIVTATGGAVDDTLSAGLVASDNKFGDMTSLTTSAKTTMVAAVNEVDANADTAQTTANTGVTNAATAQAAVDAVEVILGSSSMTSVSSASDTATGIIGNNALPAMGVTGSTTTPTTLSGAANTLNSAVGTSDVSGIVTATGGAVDDTVSAGLVASDNKFGDMTTLTTSAKTTMVAAVNEVDANADTAQTTANTGVTNAATAQAAVDAVEGILGSSSMTSVSSASDTATGIIGNNALPAMGVTGSTTTPTTLSGAANTLNSAVGTSDISGIVTAAGGAVDDTLSAGLVASDNKFGLLTSLDTTEKGTIVGAINEVAASAGPDTYTPVGTLRSFYSCTSLSDTSPTLIATGSSTVTGMLQAKQKCSNWAYQKEWESTASSIILADKGETHAYVSSSSSGSCYDAVGQLMTQEALVNQLRESGDRFYGGHLSVIRPLKVTCVDSVCETESVYIKRSGDDYIRVPALPVSCNEATCTTSAIYINYASNLIIPPREVYCGSFPCTLDGYNLNVVIIGDRTITCVGDTCSTSEVITTSSWDHSFYIPSQPVTCSGTICTIDSARYEPISLTIPVRYTTCADSDGDGVIDCANIAASSILTDSIGSSVTVPETSITCSNTYDTCKTEPFTITVTNLLGNYNYPIDSQPLSCTGSSCSIEQTIVHSYDGSAKDFFYIPVLTVGATSATAGSLENLCVHSLDY